MMVSTFIDLSNTLLNENDSLELDFDFLDDNFNFEFDEDCEVQPITMNNANSDELNKNLITSSLESASDSSSFKSTTSKKRKIIELELSISKEILNQWKLFPYKLIDILNGGNITQLTEYLRNYVDPKCVCRFFILGKVVLKEGPGAIVLLFQAMINVYPDYILSIREVTHKIINNMLVLFVKVRHLGTAMEPVNLSNYANEKLEDNILSLNHDIGRQVFNLPKLSKSQSKLNTNENKTSNEVLKLMVKNNVRLYINLETNLIVGWQSRPKISSFEVNNNDHL